MSLVEIGIVVTVGSDETGLSVKTLSWQVLDTLRLHLHLILNHSLIGLKLLNGYILSYSK